MKLDGQGKWKKATIRDLRYGTPARKLVKPDFLARLKIVWGDRVFSAKEVSEMRAVDLEGEDG